MIDGLDRALVVLAIVAMAVAVGVGGRIVERRRVARAPLDLTGLQDRVLFFTDSACRRCDVVRRRMRTLGIEFREIPYRDEPETHRRVGVTGVPLVVVRDPRGITRLAGVVSKRRLARVVSDQ